MRSLKFFSLLLVFLLIHARNSSAYGIQASGRVSINGGGNELEVAGNRLVKVSDFVPPRTGVKRMIGGRKLMLERVLLKEERAEEEASIGEKTTLLGSDHIVSNGVRRGTPNSNVKNKSRKENYASKKSLAENSEQQLSDQNASSMFKAESLSSTRQKVSKQDYSQNSKPASSLEHSSRSKESMFDFDFRDLREAAEEVLLMSKDYTVGGGPRHMLPKNNDEPLMSDDQAHLISCLQVVFTFLAH